MIFLIRSAMVALLPSTETLPGIAETDIDSYLMELRKASTFIYWLGLCLGALVFAVTPILTVGIPLPAFGLPRRLRDRHASRIVYSRIYLIRQAIYIVRLNAGFCWGKDDKIRSRFNLDPYPNDPGTWRTE